ncbi:MAG: hypothetical protein IPO26_18845 [Saprospiraceae bacterium]|nr:hypothetical protein [Saprospiraceae bacterium]
MNLPYKRNEIIENPIENNKTNEVTKENRGATFDNLNSNQKDEYSDSTDVDEINNYIIKESHLKIDFMEKIALILSTKKILLILDNVEQDRLAFQYLYSHLVGFVTILITCRVRLLGIELFLIKNFNLKQALMFFSNIFRKEHKGC